MKRGLFKSQRGSILKIHMDAVRLSRPFAKEFPIGRRNIERGDYPFQLVSLYHSKYPILHHDMPKKDQQEIESTKPHLKHGTVILSPK